MRFTEDGPPIPDALFNDRDLGRVVFFCGAGVSRARAGLPDFFGLAEAVVETLGVAEDHRSRKVLRSVRDGEVAGSISADYVFGLLEHDFRVPDIQSVVAKCLATKEKADVSAHEVLLRLATTPDARLQLVTTNFDRLFERCGRQFETHLPRWLRYRSRFDDLNGLVYLHGRVNCESDGADEDGLILSSSEFGSAYLSEGWAAEFFRQIVKKYVVVFVGYSADDPPVRYLLEGFHRTQDATRHIYAFQSDESSESFASWTHKGVKAIPYARPRNTAPCGRR